MTSRSWSDSAFFFATTKAAGHTSTSRRSGTNDSTDIPRRRIIQDISTIAVNADSYGPCVPSTRRDGCPYCDLEGRGARQELDDAPAVERFRRQLGFRVPNMVVSPFTRKHYVSHIPMDHTAVIKFVENRFIGGSAHLTARDAAQPNLLDFFDFQNVPWATPPSPPIPVTAGSLGYNPCTPTNMGP